MSAYLACFLFLLPLPFAFFRFAPPPGGQEQVAQGRRWVKTWQDAAPRLEAIRRRELRQIDAFTAISWLCGPANYFEAPRAPKPTSGLIEQQRLFRRLRRP